MPFALRKIDRKILWTNTPEPSEKAWLQPGELRADALRDMETEGNRLSVYLVDEANGVTVERIVAAMGAGRPNVWKLDYISFDTRILHELRIETEVTAGQTPDAGVNSAHVDLIHLTAARLVNFGTAMQQHGTVARKPDREVGVLINIGLRKGNIDAGKLDPQVAQKLKEAKFQPPAGK
jgi:hypothetical protein